MNNMQHFQNGSVYGSGDHLLAAYLYRIPAEFQGIAVSAEISQDAASHNKGHPKALGSPAGSGEYTFAHIYY